LSHIFSPVPIQDVLGYKIHTTSTLRVDHKLKLSNHCAYFHCWNYEHLKLLWSGFLNVRS